MKFKKIDWFGEEDSNFQIPSCESFIKKPLDAKLVGLGLGANPVIKTPHYQYHLRSPSD